MYGESGVWGPSTPPTPPPMTTRPPRPPSQTTTPESLHHPRGHKGTP